MNPLRILYVVLGFLFFGLGAFGAFVPVLPTVPFLLLASFFFSKGSVRFERWFTSTKLYHDHLESYLKNRSMTRKTKIYLLTLATIMMLLGAFLAPPIPVKIFLVAMIVFMHYYFARHIRTISPEEEMIIISEEEAWRETHKAEETITLRETVHEIKVMHEEVIEEARGAKEPADKNSVSL